MPLPGTRSRSASTGRDAPHQADSNLRITDLPNERAPMGLRPGADSLTALTMHNGLPEEPTGRTQTTCLFPPAFDLRLHTRA